MIVGAGSASAAPPPAPTISGPATHSAGHGNTTITGTGRPGDTVTVYDNGVPVCTAVVTIRRTWSCTPNVALTRGRHVLTATQANRRHQVSRTSRRVVFTSDGTPLIDSWWVAALAAALLGAGARRYGRRRPIGASTHR